MLKINLYQTCQTATTLSTVECTVGELWHSIIQGAGGGGGGAIAAPALFEGGQECPFYIEHFYVGVVGWCNIWQALSFFKGTYCALC